MFWLCVALEKSSRTGGEASRPQQSFLRSYCSIQDQTGIKTGFRSRRKGFKAVILAPQVERVASRASRVARGQSRAASKKIDEFLVKTETHSLGREDFPQAATKTKMKHSRRKVCYSRRERVSVLSSIKARRRFRNGEIQFFTHQNTTKHTH